MSTITVDKIPSKLNFSSNKVDFDIFLEKLVEYLDDLQDIKDVKNEMKNDTESFDYSSIRWNYV